MNDGPTVEHIPGNHLSESAIPACTASPPSPQPFFMIGFCCRVDGGHQPFSTCKTFFVVSACLYYEHQISLEDVNSLKIHFFSLHDTETGQ
ncbi:hypothetical protein ElyMa_004345600 [Elysia marginata]|uniref:Uncharacterized protein n=1 Tax=Elysia marginata TaxID=1093978 RepID=A0AAV4H500_9GAST|nr:hypothetical protein ElyMa_004345600 [Elysia marginata]